METKDLQNKEEVKARVIDWDYDESENTFFQGKPKEVKDITKGGYYFIRGGNGSYNMQKNVDAKLKIAFGEKQEVVRVNDEVKAYTKKSKISRKQLLEVFDDCRSGKAELFYNEKERRVRITKSTSSNNVANA